MSDIFVTSKELFQNHAPAFNFELDEDEILAKAIAVGFVTQVNNPSGGHLYMVNKNYDGEE